MVGIRLPELIIILLVMLVAVVGICAAIFSSSSKESGQPPMNPYQPVNSYQNVPPTQGNPVGYQSQATSPYVPQPAASTRFCEQCGQPIDAAAAFCPHCGASVKR